MSPIEILFTAGIIGMTLALILVSNNYHKVSNAIYEPIEHLNLDMNEALLLHLINEQRVNLGIDPLKPEVLASEICDEIAYATFNMDEKFGHDNSVARGTKSHAKFYGEIASQGYRGESSVIFAHYMLSPEHKKIIENPLYEWVGISIIGNINYCLFTKY